jgi:hypothetical protein
MGFRPDLDLTGILNLHQPTLPSREEAEAMRKVQEGDDSLRYDTPVRLGWGPARWSTSMTLVPVERVCHDVNGYYRELGVDWRATRKELREAYQALDGQSSARLTYVFKQLLDPVTREAYDKSPKGEVFLDDYTEDDLKRRAHEEASRRSTLGQAVSADEVLDDWGYMTLDPEEGVDSVRAVREDLPQRKAARENWKYSYYAWKTESFVQNEVRLREWQELLSKATAQVGTPAEVAIGVTSMVRLSDQWFIIEPVDGKPVVFFFTDVEPTTEIAEQALTEFLNFP